MALLEVRDASYTYPQSEKPALSHVNISISSGEYVAVVGSNGSGKSTFARLAAGFIAPESGTAVLADGVLPGIVFQQPKEQIVAGVVERDTAFGPQNLDMSKAEIELRTMECLSVTGLLDRASSRTFALSLGQTQRLAFSGILALFPDFLILDEVTAMLDPSSRKEILSLIDEWHRKGHTILHVTHDKDEALAASRVIVLSGSNESSGTDSSVLFDGPSAAFKKDAHLVSLVFGDERWFEKKVDVGKENSFVEKINAKRNSLEQDAVNESVQDDVQSTLQVNDLSFSYPDFSAVKKQVTPVFTNLSFSLNKGTLTALTGPSGCGKSTLLECLAGLLTPTSGTISTRNEPVHDSGETAGSGVTRPSLALQESEAALFETFAADDVAFGPQNKGLVGKELLTRVKNAMAVVGLPYETFGNRQTFMLSGGEKRKLSLAGIIALDSDIMLFDEPTAGLDPQSRVTVMQTLRTLAQNGKTVLFSTHRMEEAQFADREISWAELTSSSQPGTTLQQLTPLPNSEMILSLQKTSASFTAPSTIPNSLVSRMAPVLKYILFFAMFISSIAVRPLWLCCALLGGCVLYSLLSKYPLKKPVWAFIKLFPWLLVFAVFQFLFFPAEQGETLLVHWGLFTISMSKIQLVLCMMVRTASAVFCIGTFIFTTSEREILDGLTDFLKPLALLKMPVRYAVLVVGIIFRFIPLLLDEASGILKTQLVRGGLGKARGFGKIKALLPLFVPLMLQTFRKAQSFADALTARYFK